MNYDFIAPSIDQIRNYYLQKNFTAAKNLCNQILKHQPGDALVYHILGDILKSQDNISAAIRTYTKAIEIQPDWEIVWLKLARLYCHHNYLEQAIAAYQKVIIINQNCLEAHYNLGIIFQKQGNLLAAIASYKQAIINQPCLVQAHLKLADTMVQKGDLDEASRSYKRVLQIKPDLTIVSYYIEQLEEVQNEIEKKLQSCPEVIFLQPDLAADYFNQGNAFAQQGKLNEAINSYKKAIEINLDFIEVYYNLGIVLWHFANLGNVFYCVKLSTIKILEVVNCYQKVIALKPNWAEAYFYLGNALRRINKIDQAIAYWRQALTLKPELLEIYQPLADAIYLLGNLDEYLQMLQKFKQVQHNLARTYQLDRLGIRFLSSFWSCAIGQMAFLDVYIKTTILGCLPPHRPILLASPAQISNKWYLQYWIPYIQVISDPEQIKNLAPLAKYLTDDIGFITFANQEIKNLADTALATQKQWETEGRAPLLKLSESDQERGWSCLRELGVPKDSWFVGLHVREGGFYGEKANRTIRNADPHTYSLAIQSIVDRGGWVIRMGDRTMKPLPAMAQVIDYAHSDLKSDWMDVFLWGQCRFFIGTASGPASVVPTFGVPCLITNLAQMKFQLWYSNIISIAKLQWLEPEQRYLTFAEILSSSFSYIEYREHFAVKQITVVDNTPEEINDLVLEMLERLEGTIKYTLDDEHLQEKWHSLAKTYKISGLSRMGQAFLRKYAHLLPEN